MAKIYMTASLVQDANTLATGLLHHQSYDVWRNDLAAIDKMRRPSAAVFSFVTRKPVKMYNWRDGGDFAERAFAQDFFLRC